VKRGFINTRWKTHQDWCTLDLEISPPIILIWLYDPMPNGHEISPPFVIMHPTLRDASDSEWAEFGLLLVAGLREWLNTIDVDPAGVLENRRNKLFAELAVLLITKEMAELWNYANVEGQRGRAGATGDAAHRLVLALVSPLRPRTRGRKRKNDARDAQIYSLRKDDMSFGQIGIRMGTERLVVIAAYRREEKRRTRLYELYQQLREGLKPLGIDLKEQRRKATPVAKSNR
jgi:hypothetical protein